MRKMLLPLLLSQCGLALSAPTVFEELETMTVGSDATLWNQRNLVEKSAYLEGFCSGLSADPNSPYGQLQCKQSITSEMRFCMLIWKSPNGREQAISFFDTFYKSRTHSDIPNWAVVGAYNDKACNENNVSSSLPKMQKRNECFRALSNLGAGVSQEAIKKQKEHCKSLNF